jgi:hypothetical protein
MHEDIVHSSIREMISTFIEPNTKPYRFKKGLFLQSRYSTLLAPYQINPAGVTEGGGGLTINNYKYSNFFN